MATAISWALAILLVGIPTLLLAMAIRHFVPLVRGINAPLWGYFIAPLLFLSDRFWNEAARPHRRKFLAYMVACVGVCIFLVHRIPNP